ncbi:MAG: hypothetical protein J3Q66DRAFT_321481 [Benniella sp.]|nr:MAG: hypothetical protein J3Q66DRAFT_321481 [Benniella sp.]
MADNKNMKVERSSGNLQSSERKGDLSMQSEHDAGPNQSRSTPMRVAAAMRSDDQRFKVAGDDFGGGMREKDLPPIPKDDKSFVIDTTSTIPVGRGYEPVHRSSQKHDDHTKVGYNPPDIEGGEMKGRNNKPWSTSTETSSAEPTHRSQRASTSEPVSQESLLQPPGLPHKEPAGPHRHSQARTATPELNLGELFPEEKQPNRASNLSASAKAYPGKLGPSSAATSVTTGHEASNPQPMIGAYRETPVNVSVSHSPSISSPAVATPDSGAAPLHEAPASTLKSHKRQVLGEAYDEPIQASSSLPQHQQSKQFESNDGLNAASYPSFATSAPQSSKDNQVQGAHAKRRSRLRRVRHDNVPKQPRKLSKRERKAIKKREAEKGMGMLDTISTVFVGRKKNSVSTPVLHLNEVFGAPSPDLPLSPSQEDHPSFTAIGASTVAAIAGGIGGNIRSLVGSMNLHSKADEDVNDSNRSSSTSDRTDTVEGLRSHKHEPSTAAMLKTPVSKINLGLFPEEEAEYPRTDANRNFSENPTHPPNVMDVIEESQISKVHPTSQSTATTHLNRPGKTHSGAVALKAPKLDLLLFPEEQADYPRADDLHLSDDRMSHPFVRTHAVEEIQLDDAHRHPHHDLHPTITESASAVVSQGIEGVKSLLEGVPSMINNTRERVATAALATVAGSAAMHHVPSAPEITSPRTAVKKDSPHVGPSHEVDSNKDKDSELDLKLDSEEAKATKTASNTSIAPSSIRGHQEIVPVYKEPVSNVPLTSGTTMQHVVATPHPQVSQQKLAQESHLEQEPKKFIYDEAEHHRRHMDIHPTVSEKDFEQHLVEGTVVPQNDPAVVLCRKFEPVQVLPDAPLRTMIHANDKGDAMVSGAPQHQQSQGQKSSAKIPIAQPPSHLSELGTKPANRRTSLPSPLHPSKATEATPESKGQRPQDSTNPFVTFAARARANQEAGKGTTHIAVTEAAPLMAAAAMGVKPDKVVIMNAGDHHSHQGQQKAQNEGHYDLHPLHPMNNDHRHDHHQQQQPVGAIPVRVEHGYDHSHHHGYGSETGKKLEDEEESEIKDTVGDLTPAQAYAAAHKSNLPGTTMPETVWPQQMQQDEAVRDKDLEGEPARKKPLATTVPSAPSMGATTSTAAPTMDTKTVTREQHAPISAARPVDTTTATDPLRNPKWGSTTARATGGDTSQVVDHQPYQSQYRHQTTTEPVIHKGIVAAESHVQSQPTSHAGDQVSGVKKTRVTQAYDHDNRGEIDHGHTADTATGAAGTAGPSGEESGASDHHKDHEGSLFHRISQKLSSGRRKSRADPHPYHTTHQHQQGDNAVHGRRGPAQ